MAGVIRRGIIALVVLAAVVAVLFLDFGGPSTWTPTEAQLHLYRNGCPGGGPVCDEEPTVEGGLECWAIDEIRWCRPIEVGE